jgi:hypothetical protein
LWTEEFFGLPSEYFKKFAFPPVDEEFQYRKRIKKHSRRCLIFYRNEYQSLPRFGSSNRHDYSGEEKKLEKPSDREWLITE